MEQLLQYLTFQEFQFGSILRVFVMVGGIGFLILVVEYTLKFVIYMAMFIHTLFTKFLWIMKLLCIIDENLVNKIMRIVESQKESQKESQYGSYIFKYSNDPRSVMVFTHKEELIKYLSKNFVISAYTRPKIMKFVDGLDINKGEIIEEGNLIIANI
jgi:hypothetical protein